MNKEDKYQELSHRETELINHRITQLLTSQTIIFAGYVAMLSIKKDDLCVKNELWDKAQLLLPCLGFLTSVLILIGILSAIFASLILYFRFRPNQLGVHWLSTLGGWFSASFFPILFCMAWNTLIDSFSIERLFDILNIN